MSHRRILIVCHGSRSPRWVAAQNEWFHRVRERLRAAGAPVEPLLTFLEITEPLFEGVLAALARERDPAFFPGGELGIFPFFLSRSGHAGEDIPAIASRILHPAGLDWKYLPAEGWAGVLGANAERRLEAAGCMPGDPVVVSGYGSSGDDGEWRGIVAAIQRNAGRFGGGEPWLWAPAGHFLPDAATPLREALEGVCASGGGRAAILPLYLAVSSYQETLIPSVVGEFPSLEVKFTPTAVLPDEDMVDWAARRLAGEGVCGGS